MIAALALMVTLQTAQPAVPGDVMFLLFKVTALRQTAHERRCGTAREDARYDVVRDRLIARYGKTIFSPKNQPKGPPGDCGVVLVYDLNLRDLEKAVAAPAAKGD